MKNTIKSRKGATLAELLVVLAVLVIAATMVVSFSSMMHGAQGISNARLEALQEVHLAESLIEGFIENSEKAIEIKDGDKLYLMGEDNASVFFSTGKVLYVYGNDVMFLESIESIKFDTARYAVINNNILSSNSSVVVGGITPSNGFTSSDVLYYCTITYSVGDTLYTYTFCVNPYVGEEVN